MSILEFFHPAVMAFLTRAFGQRVVEDVIEYIKKREYDVSGVERPEKWILSMLISQDQWLKKHPGEAFEAREKQTEW